MPRSSDVDVVGWQTRGEPPTDLVGAVFPSDRLVIQRNGVLVFYHDKERAPLDRAPLTDDTEASRARGTRTGVLYRNEDPTGVSGTGVVADFAEFSNGWVIQEWRNEENGNLETRDIRDSGMNFRPSISLAVRIHGHNGRTEYVYDNGEVARP